MRSVKYATNRRKERALREVSTFLFHYSHPSFNKLNHQGVVVFKSTIRIIKVKDRPAWLDLFMFIICFLLIQIQLNAQQPMTAIHMQRTDSIKQNYKPEILTSGFFDIVSNGQVNASARFIRLLIGEPGKFSIPLSVYSGVASNYFQQNAMGGRTNEQLLNQLINPLSGLTNVSIDGIFYWNKNRKTVSRCGLIFQVGEKILTGYKTGGFNDPWSGKPVNFLNTYSVTGLYFQTGAWESKQEKNVGLFWLTLRYIANYSSPRQLNSIFLNIVGNGWYHGYSIGWGVEISQLVNIKVLYYKYIKTPEAAFGLPIYQCSFHYALK